MRVKVVGVTCPTPSVQVPIASWFAPSSASVTGADGVAPAVPKGPEQMKAVVTARR